MRSLLVGLCALVLVGLCGLAALQTPGRLSAQGCRMAWMSPSYQLQDKFDEAWTPLAHRYSLWLYREVGWEHELHGQPVLFIPGHAGSSHQVRSIASSSTRQFFSQPGVSALSKSLTAVDYFALEFNEDFSALHGPTLATERAYAAAAMEYILSLYPPRTRLVLLAHSMGGVVATALLPNANVSALITMATPHTLPPARFDRRIAALYAHTAGVLANDPTPIVSVCGGATDTLVPSESCILPELPAANGSAPTPFRRTVFASALEGAWTGVGHLAIVWCDQVRWRVARAILELSARSPHAHEAALDKWLSDGSRLPPPPKAKETALHTATIATDPVLHMTNPAAPKTYLLHMPSTPQRFTLFVSGGAVPPVAPQRVGRLRVSVLLCASTERCTPLAPETHKLVPQAAPGKPFPVPDEGADESAGVVLFEAPVYPNVSSAGGYVAVRVEAADGAGVLVAGFSALAPHTLPVSRTSNALVWMSMFTGSIAIAVDPAALSTHIHLPVLLSHTLLVYRATPRFVSPEACAAAPAVLHPLLTMHSPHEVHYHPLHPSAPPALLHAHAGAPYLPSPARGLNLTVHADGGACRLTQLDLTLDARATVGRWSARLWPALVASAVGVAALVLAAGLGAPAPQPVGASLRALRLGPLLLAALGTALLPLPIALALGTGGAPLFAPLAPAVVLCGVGLVVLSAHALAGLLAMYRAALRPAPPQPERRRAGRTALVSAALVALVVLLLVPWQVAFVGCWLLLFHATAAAAAAGAPHVHEHVLLLLTWLLPLAAPVLAVWARTLVTAGYTTPFGADHNVLYALPFLVLADALSAPAGAALLLTRHPREKVSACWGLVLMAAMCFLLGASKTYLIFDCAALSVGLLVLCRLVPSYV